MLKTSWWRLENAFSVPNILAYKTPPRRVWKAFWRGLASTSWRRFEDVLKMFWRCLEDVSKMYSEDILQTRLENSFRSSWKKRNVWWGATLLMTTVTKNSTLDVDKVSRVFKLIKRATTFKKNKARAKKYWNSVSICVEISPI